MSTANATGAAPAATPSKAQSMIDAYNAQESDSEDGSSTVDDSTMGADAVDDTGFDGEAQVDSSGVIDAQAPEGGTTSPQEDGSVESAPKGDKAKGGAEIEEKFEVEDADGIKREVSVKFDAKTRKKLVHAAAQRQRFQSERDRAIAKLQESEKKSSSYDRLNDAWTSSADPVERVKALVSTLVGGEEAFNDAVAKEVELRTWLASASPADKAKWESDQRAKKAEAALATERKRIEEERKAASEKSRAADDAQYESSVQSAFDSMRFSGKLKDEVLADRLDRQVFAASIGTVTAAIETARTNGKPLTPAQVNALAKTTFQEHFKALKALIKDQVKEGTTAAIDAAKSRAANAMSKAAEGGGRGSAAQAKPSSGSRSSMRSAILASMRK